MLFIRKSITLFLVLLCFFSTASAAEIVLTEEEADWLQRNAVIRYAPAPNYPPIEYFDETQRHLGVTPELLDLMLAKVDLPIRIERFNTWEEVMSATRLGKVDMLGSVAKLPKRQAYLNFSEPYITLPTVIYMRENEGYGNLSLEELSGKRVVVIEDYASADFVQDNFPEISLIKVPEISIGIRMVSYGMADAIVVSRATAAYYMQQHSLTNLEVVGETGMTWKLRFAVRKDWPELNGIIQKALDTVSEAELEALIGRHLKQGYATQVLSTERLKEVSVWVGACLLVMLFALNLYLIWRHRGHKYHLENTQKQKHELESQLQRLQTIDAETGLTTRHAFLAEANKELARYHRYGSSFAIFVIEVPSLQKLRRMGDFKTAEEVMKQLSVIINEEIREQDLCGDLGDGCLGVLLLKVDEMSADIVGKRLRQRVDSPGSLHIHGVATPASLLIGVAVPRAVTGSVDELIQLADSKLYAMGNPGE